MPTGKVVICKGCTERIEGEYVIKKADDREECYHPDCARAHKVKLPVQIRFTE